MGEQARGRQQLGCSSHAAVRSGRCSPEHRRNVDSDCRSRISGYREREEDERNPSPWFSVCGEQQDRAGHGRHWRRSRELMASSVQAMEGEIGGGRE
ncbi:hypothetical protein U9M48_043216 [Paspalum notatum var. saurae]|uniref:Uncharacterized protein n=1 Tax=Paspalum notatum var. saurae TaxID=547442 RepID=A0AAQ3UWJ3_PASNO